MTTEETTEQPPVDDCLKERKWWCFLLSSIFTFLAGLLIVLLWRAFAFLCCRKEPEFAPNDPKQKEPKASRQGKEFEGTFMTEAKDWAGELISGQTTTGLRVVTLLCAFTKKVKRDLVTSANVLVGQILTLPLVKTPYTYYKKLKWFVER
ncbi:unnamed protein product [Heterotrigona itama]|uniref:Calcium-activated potassium channel BK alpha subunit domain-containing protein n=1 Tax=Heterotrigona itama TaxID=395501 RepID=A0A6V7H008_9HYME|nr:unnamed protein product [Heterotrigona itama]